uniref:Uncharacterized protein n=1 Tax=Cyanistes caeruleus TaxID=156563 RepID=A0A8C0UBQ7_CYACU
MSYCGGLQYYCKLGATRQAMHICYVSSLILDLETNLDSNSVSFDVPAGRVVSGGRGKHPVYKTARKKIQKISLAPTDFKREELIRM